MRPGILGEAHLDFRKRLRMTEERHAKRGRSRLSRMVVGRRTHAAEGENEIAGSERFAQHRREPSAIVAFVARPCEREPAGRKRCDHVCEMAVSALARQDLVADDQRADTRNHRQSAAASASGNWVSICDIIEPNARSMSGSASTRRARSSRKRSASSSAVIDNAFCPCLLVKR